MIAIQDFSSFSQVELVGRRHLPGQFADDLQPGADDAVLGAGAGDGVEPIELAVGFFHHQLGELGRFELGAELVDFAATAGAAFAVAELFADRLQLLLQVVATLAFVDVLFDLRLDLVLQFQHVELRRESGRR